MADNHGVYLQEGTHLAKGCVVGAQSPYACAMDTFLLGNKVLEKVLHGVEGLRNESSVKQAEEGEVRSGRDPRLAPA